MEGVSPDVEHRPGWIVLLLHPCGSVFRRPADPPIASAKIYTYPMDAVKKWGGVSLGLTPAAVAVFVIASGRVQKGSLVAGVLLAAALLFAILGVLLLFFLSPPRRDVALFFERGSAEGLEFDEAEGISLLLQERFDRWKGLWQTAVNDGDGALLGYAHIRGTFSGVTGTMQVFGPDGEFICQGVEENRVQQEGNRILMRGLHLATGLRLDILLAMMRLPESWRRRADRYLHDRTVRTWRFHPMRPSAEPCARLTCSFSPQHLHTLELRTDASPQTNGLLVAAALGVSLRSRL